MITYLKRSISKFKDDALAKAIYDVVKYLAVIVCTYLVLTFFPSESFIGNLLKTSITLTYTKLGLILLVTIALTILIYFVINKNRFTLINKDLRTDRLTTLNNDRALKEDLPGSSNGRKGKIENCL